MIASLRGTVLAVVGGTAIVEVGGVGLQVSVTPDHALAMRVGSEVSMRTALIVREDELALYGFSDVEGREVFDLLRGVSGVGPKSAMGVLAAMSPAEIAGAVAREDDGAFRKVSGIGPKTAKLIVVSLAGKLHEPPVAGKAATTAPASIAENVLGALVGLGWSERVAAQAVDEAIAAAAEEERGSVPLLLRNALSRLGPAAR
ncbi:MAG TPA: Holliday junction branch migration protein RuvA [Terrimesophilobacter sp.]|nr:Holliday junction branch migration protein RuvA [Terrimesophilobacter sp.]